MSHITAQLVRAGLSTGNAESKQILFDSCMDSLGDLAVQRRTSTFFIPGRIEVLGKHTDYAGGRSLLCAVERGFVCVAVPRDDQIARVSDALRGEACDMPLDPDFDAPRNHWSSYVAASVRRLARNFPEARRGADIVFASDLPPASGLSSSSALSTAIFHALDAVNEYHTHPLFRAVIKSREDLAGYLGTIENGQSYGPLAGDSGVGTFGGSEDHTAILCCRKGVLSCYSFTPVRKEADISLSPELSFVIAFSGVHAEKGSGAQERYNELSLGTQRILSLWNEASNRTDTSLAAAVTSAGDAGIRAVIARSRDAEFTADRLLERFDQFVEESVEIIPAACDALARSNLTSFGNLVRRSQAGAESMLRNQIPATVDLVRMARHHGAHAASAFGAGFGGSVWALVDMSRAREFALLWQESYGATYPAQSDRAEFFLTSAGPGAMRL